MNTMPQDLRILAMIDWLEHDLLLTINHCEPASSDASFRRYFRITTPEGKFIVMDAPPLQENVEAFIRIAELLTHFGVHVPAIYKKNVVDGFLLLEDFGQFSFLEKINEQTIVELYKTALDSLFLLQTKTAIENSGLPSYNAQLLQKELDIFEDWFLGHLLDIPISQLLWKNTCHFLIESALEQPLICVHRDYHSRNLMVLAGDNIGILDFQDAVIGPITYDLVSLLRDCYIALSEEQVNEWMTDYYQRLYAVQLISCSAEQFKRWFDLMGVQHHLKAIGIFSRLHLRDGKPGYLKDIPRTLNYVSHVCSYHSELTEFHEFLQNNVLTILDKNINP